MIADTHLIVTNSYTTSYDNIMNYQLSPAAITSDGTIHVLYGYRKYISSVFYWTTYLASSSDKGVTWTLSSELAIGAYQSTAVIIADSEDTLHIFYGYYHISKPLGGIWSSPELVINDTANSSGYPRALVDSQNNLYVAYNAGGSVSEGKSIASVIVKKPYGGSWGARQYLSTVIYRGFGNVYIDVDANDTVHIIYKEMESWPGTIPYRTSYRTLNSSGTLSSPEVLITNDIDGWYTPVSIICDSSGEVHILITKGQNISGFVWYERYVYKRNGGSWNQITKVAGLDKFGGSYSQLARLVNDDIYCYYILAKDNNNTSLGYNAFFKKYSSGSWGSATTFELSGISGNVPVNLLSSFIYPVTRGGGKKRGMAVSGFHFVCSSTYPPTGGYSYGQAIWYGTIDNYVPDAFSPLNVIKTGVSRIANAFGKSIFNIKKINGAG